jgi:hypothetical protein
MHRSKQDRYSINSSARANTDWGTDNPSAFAVFKLTASSYLAGAWTGRSAGFSPLNMRSTLNKWRIAYLVRGARTPSRDCRRLRTLTG